MAKKPSATALPAEGRVSVVVGDPFLRTEHTAALKKKLEAARGEVDQIRFEGQSAEPAEVLDECRSFGLMQQHKLVVVEEADKFVNAETRPLLERYCASAPDSATLVLRADTWRPGNLDKRIAACGGVVLKCEPPAEGQAVAWAIKRCEQRHGAKLERDAATALVIRLGADLGRIDSELGKLSSAAGRSPCGDPVPIDRRLVDQFVAPSKEESAWDIQADLLSGNAEATLKHLRDLLEVSRLDTVFVGFAMSDLARKLHLAACGLAGGADPWQLGKELKLWPNDARDAILRAAGRLGPERTAALFDDALAADVAQKSGLGEGRRHLERLALRFAGAV